MSNEETGTRGTLLRGALDLLVLRVLARGPLHGFGITKMLGELSQDWLQLEEGSLYPCLYRMEARGWVTSSLSPSKNNRRARYYEITSNGKDELHRQVRNWREFSNVVGAVLDRG
jgi:transcriptional regulator